MPLDIRPLPDPGLTLRAAIARYQDRAGFDAYVQEYERRAAAIRAQRLGPRADPDIAALWGQLLDDFGYQIPSLDAENLAFGNPLVSGLVEALRVGAVVCNARRDDGEYTKIEPSAWSAGGVFHIGGDAVSFLDSEVKLHQVRIFARAEPAASLPRAAGAQPADVLGNPALAQKKK